MVWNLWNETSYGLLPRTGILKTTDTLDTVGFQDLCVICLFYKK